MIPTRSRLSYASGYIELGMVKEAERELQGIVTTDRLNQEVLVMKVRLFLASKKWKQMITISKTLADKFSEDSFGWVNWAYALRELDQNQEAKEVALKGTKRHPKDAILWYNLACYCSLLGEMEEAQQHLLKSQDLDKNFKEEAKSDPDLNNLFEWISNKGQS